MIGWISQNLGYSIILGLVLLFFAYIIIGTSISMIRYKREDFEREEQLEEESRRRKLKEGAME